MSHSQNSSGDVHLVPDGVLGQRLRAAFPARGVDIDKKAAEIISDWLEDREDAGAVKRARKFNAGKPNTSLAEVKKELGL